MCAGRLRPCYRKYSTQSIRQLIQLKNAPVNAFTFTSPEPAHTSSPDRPLSKYAIAVKNNICTIDMPTTCSSAMLQDFISPFDATVVQLLRKAGVDIVGKTNCDEFGMGSLNLHSVHGPVINPYQDSLSTQGLSERERRSAGGSSGGSAAAVAAGMCHAALATDTGGSTRLPASYCGVVGMKPSYGLLSRWGVVSFADSLDCVGIIAKDLAIVGHVFETLNIHDPKDPTTAPSEVRNKASSLAKSRMHSWSLRGDCNLTGLRIGIPQEYFPSELSPPTLRPLRRVLSTLRSHGAMLVPVSLPSTSYALSAYYVISSAEASSNLARYDGIQYGLHVLPPVDSDKSKTSTIYSQTRSHGFGHEVQKRILLGTYALTADAFDNYFLQAQRVRTLVRDDFDRVFCVPNVLTYPEQTTGDGKREGVDVLVHPSAIRTAPLLPAGPQEKEDSLDAYVQDVLTVPASLAGLPALSVPAPPAQDNVDEADDGWPVGVSVVGQWGCDEMVLRVGEAIARITQERGPKI